MANDFLSPFQQFFGNTGAVDDPPEPLARGTLTFYTDNTRTTLLTMLSGSNPYTLNDFGEVRGDVAFAGSCTIVVANEAGLEIRQLDDVIPGNDGDLGEITLMMPSIAAMKTDESLVLGQLVRTEGYYDGTRYGGARYVIVAASTGVVDDYLYHQLNNGLQAQLTDLEDHKNFLVAGARGDGGSNDTDPMQRVLNQGGDIHVPRDFTFMATNLSLTQESYRFSGGGAMKQLGASSGDLFQITSTA